MGLAAGFRALRVGWGLSGMTQNTQLRQIRQHSISGRTAFDRVPLARPQPAATSIYIHVPFCFHKCHYCDFYSFVDTQDRQEPYVNRLTRELAAQAPWTQGRPIRTIFVGGGTPSLLRVDLWRRLLSTLHATFNLSTIAHEGEFTVECNPETVTLELMDTLVAGGVNRVSLGAQSFDTRHLKTLERWHDPASVRRALDLARAAGIPRQSIDLIFGIPGQTLAEWDADLRQALDLGTTHLSCYNLTYEPGTAMTARLHRGDFATAPEDLEVEMYEHTHRALAAAGLHRYEVSNYARPGQEARHNLAYWRQESWLACGPSASGHLLTQIDHRPAGLRWKNLARLDDWLTVDDQGFAPVIDVEHPDPARFLRERLMTGLRLAEGLDPAEMRTLAAAIDPAAPARLDARARAQIAAGMLHDDTTRWRVTDAGWLHADGVAAHLMAAVPDRPNPT